MYWIIFFLKIVVSTRIPICEHGLTSCSSSEEIIKKYTYQNKQAILGECRNWSSWSKCRYFNRSKNFAKARNRKICYQTAVNGTESFECDVCRQEINCSTKSVYNLDCASRGVTDQDFESRQAYFFKKTA